MWITPTHVETEYGYAFAYAYAPQLERHVRIINLYCEDDGQPYKPLPWAYKEFDIFVYKKLDVVYMKMPQKSECWWQEVDGFKISKPGNEYRVCLGKEILNLINNKKDYSPNFDTKEWENLLIM